MPCEKSERKAAPSSVQFWWHGDYRRSNSLGRIRSAVAESVSVTVDRRCAAEMGVEHLRSVREEALPHQIDHALHRLSLIHGVGDHALESRAKSDRFFGRVGRNAVGRMRIV